ncbi:NAD(P)H-dependent oxidoreductase subunit E [Bacteroidota bacterium]
MKNEHLIRELVEKHGRSRTALMPILQGVEDARSYISDSDMIEIAKELDLSAAQVFGTATFYSFLSTEPLGKYVIRVCKTITCDMHGKRQILQTIEEMLKVSVGETTPNKKFSLLETNCLGWCHEGPAMLINEKPYTGLTPERVHDIISDYISNS